MSFTGDTKLKDIATSNPAARQVLENAGLDYCCGGGNSLQEACVRADVPAEEILRRLRENSHDVNPEEAAWTSAPLNELTRHIREKHHRYVREAIRRIQPLLDKVKTKHGANHPELGDIEKFFAAVSREMTMHMQKEEQILFPYIDALQRSADGAGPVEIPFFQTVRNPIQAMMREHDASGDLVKQIRAAASEYRIPADACASYEALYQELRGFEADLHEHVHLENNILFPRAVDAEAKAS